MHANFRAINSELLLDLFCFLNIDSSWLSQEQTELKLQGDLKTNAPNKNSVPVLSAACSAPCSPPLSHHLPLMVQHLLTAAPALPWPGLSWSHCCMGCDYGEGEMEGEPWVFGGRCLLHKTETPGSALKQKQRAWPGAVTSTWKLDASLFFISKILLSLGCCVLCSAVLGSGTLNGCLHL